MEDFGEKGNGAGKFILCLHGLTGAPLTEEELRKSPELWDYLCKYRVEMEERKGVFIQTFVKKGSFWALLGAGPYCFTKYKVAWMAQGNSRFKAVVVDGRLQGNQAMHTYVPCKSLEDANRISSELNAILPQYLSRYEMDGTGIWAQPGNVKKLLSFGPTGKSGESSPEDIEAG